MERIGLIAGNGLFPVEFAREARGRGLYVAAVAHEGETREEIEEVVDSLVWIKVGQIGRMIRSLQDQGVRRAVMAGGIDKPRTLSTFRPDLRAARLLARARGLGRGMGDDTLLGALADELAGAGIEIVPSTLFLENILAGAGLIAGPRLDSAARQDVAIGARVLEAVSPLDVGQAVVVENGVVLAVEAVEGTDALIRRAGRLGSGKGVVVKAAKRGQDLRFDVPAVGPQTLEVMAESGVRALVVEARRTIALDLDRMRELASSHRLTFAGFTASTVGSPERADSADGARVEDSEVKPERLKRSEHGE